MSLSNVVRQCHRWISMLFTLTVIANLIAMSMAQGQMPPPWIVYAPLLPLVLLMISGLYLFVLPYATRRRAGKETGA